MVQNCSGVAYILGGILLFSIISSNITESYQIDINLN